ncbi:MAG: DNA adenine methylase [Acidimicrobiales bacterium]|jgi:adenine-specific DNA-methyltransferase
MIKYLGSKRRLVPALAVLAGASGARTGLDLFCGTTRVSQAFKALGLEVTAVDSARCAHVLARCYVATDPDASPTFRAEVADAVDRLNAVPGHPGYVTRTFCDEARYFRPANGARIDAVREVIEADYAGTPLWPVLLTSLLEAADRVDSTTGLQMAYLKQWAPRADRPLVLRVPEMVPGPGRAVRGDACALVGTGALPDVDLAYLDPPYNQHRYDSNYHVWETLVAWDAPEHYGVACKRTELRDPTTRSAFNGRRTMAPALADVIARVAAEVVVLSYNNESWLTFEELREVCAARGHVEVLAFDSARYVGARIGIHDPTGRKVGTVSHLRNTEYVVLCGPKARIRAMAGAVESTGSGARVDRPVPVPVA